MLGDASSGSTPAIKRALIPIKYCFNSFGKVERLKPLRLKSGSLINDLKYFINCFIISILS